MRRGFRRVGIDAAESECLGRTGIRKPQLRETSGTRPLILMGHKALNQSTVNTIEMKRACERLLARLPDERDSGNSSVVFTADRDSLCVQVGDSSETILAMVTVFWHGPNVALLSQEEDQRHCFG
jgi:hypothetical protein